MIGAVGADPFGAFMRDTLSQAGVHTGLIRSLPDVATGIAVITVAGGENSIVVVAGANAKLAVEDGSLPIERGDVVVAQLEVPSASWSAAFEAARAAGATTILNAAPASAEIADLLPLCDIVVVNEIELGSLSGRPLSEAADPSDLLEGMRAVRRTSEQVVITTRGGSGLVSLGPEGVIEVAGHKVPVIDSTGAGDCFVGALAACLLVDRDLRRVLALANAAAAVSVQRPGAGSSMPTRDEVIEQFGVSLPDPGRPRGDGCP
jgi:ribokinase